MVAILMREKTGRIGNIFRGINSAMRSVKYFFDILVNRENIGYVYM